MLVLVRLHPFYTLWVKDFNSFDTVYGTDYGMTIYTRLNFGLGLTRQIS